MSGAHKPYKAGGQGAKTPKNGKIFKNQPHLDKIRA